MSAQPRLLRGVTITRRQISEDEIYYLVRDPRTGSFLRMGEAEAAVLRLLDGRRTMADVAGELDRSHGFDVAPVVVERFVATLARRGLVETGGFDPAAFRQEWLIQQRARRQSLGRLLGTLATLKVRLFNPRWLFARITGPLGFFWTRGFVIVSLAVIAAGAVMAIVHHEAIAGSTRAFYAEATSSAGAFASNAAIIYIAFFIVVAVHELAHGLTCAHFGGKVTDMGFILFYLQVPGFYCDITDAYGFDRRSHRLWVTIAGGYTGLVLAGLAVFLWWATETGDALNKAAIMLMIVGGPPVLALNWNPLIRLDGYYILMDLLEAPNLMDNSAKYLGYLIKSRLLRVPAEPVEVPPRLRKVYVIYGVASFLFLAPLILSMPTVIHYMLARVVGGPIALVAAVILGLRILKRPAAAVAATARYAWLSHRPALMAGQHGSGRLAVLGAGATAALLIGLFGPRFALRVGGEGRLEPLDRIEVRAVRPGFVTDGGLPDDGAVVAAGEVLARLENPEMEAARDAARLELEQTRLRLSAHQARGEPAAAAVRRGDEQAGLRRVEGLSRQIDDLTLRSPIGGVVLTPRLRDRVGQYLPEGGVWCVVGRIDRLRVRVPVTETDLGVIGADSLAEVRGLHLPGTTVPARVARLPAGLRSEPPPADPARARQVTAAGPLPLPVDDTSPVSGSLGVELEVDNTGGLLRPGMTVRVRIYGERLTAAEHAARWARRLFKGKVWW